MATWDDHDYGINNGGAEFPKKKEAQKFFQIFLMLIKKVLEEIRKAYTIQKFLKHKKPV